MMPGRDEQRGVAPAKIRVPHAILETTLSTLLVPGLGTIVWPEDPLFLSAGFPYLLFAPLLPALRYGFAYGFGSAVALVIVISIAWGQDLLPRQTFPVELCFGLLTVTMIVGEFTNVWHRRGERAWAGTEYCQVRLNEFIPRYYLLKASHDQLEQRLAGSSQSLRTALQTVRERFGPANERPDFEQVGDEILSLFSSFCSVQVASVYRVQHNTEVSWPPCATLGSGTQIPPDHPFIQESLKLHRTVSAHFRRDDKSELREREEDLLAVIPITDAFHNLWALIVVQEMPFMSFHHDNLVLMSVLGGAIGDQLTSAMEQTPTGDSTEQDFRLHVRRCLEDRRDHDLPASVVSFVLNPEFASTRLLDQIVAQKRSLDLPWRCPSRDGDTVLTLLLPLTEEIGAAGFLARVEKHFRGRLGKTPEEAGIEIHPTTLTRTDTVDEIVTQIQGLKLAHDHTTVDPTSAVA